MRRFFFGRGDPLRHERREREDVRLSREIEEELRFHLESREAELVGQGASEESARRQAAAEFGDLAAARHELAALTRRESVRRHRRSWLLDLIQDLRIGGRTLLRQPGLLLALLFTLGLGVGATSAIYTVFRATLLQPLPYGDAGRIVHVWETHSAGDGVSEASWPDFLDWRTGSRAFDGLEGYDPTNIVVSGASGAAMLRGARVTSGFFALLGVAPVAGRAFRSGEDGPGGSDFVILSDGFWRREYGADPSAVGRTIRINGRSHEIIGVLPRRFHYAPAGDAELWLPVDQGQQTRDQRFNHWLNVVGRLSTGVRIADAHADLTRLMDRLATEHPETNRGRGVRIVPVREQIAGNLRPVLIALLAAVGLLLLIACSNVTSLLLARSLGRTTELLVRAALGASRGRLLRQLVAECVLLAALGAALGLALANAGVRALIMAIPFGAMDGLGFLRDIRPDAGVVLFTVLLALASGLGSGLLAGWSGTRVLVSAGLQGSGLRTTSGVARARVRSLLVAGQLSFTVVLLVGAILVGRSLLRLVDEDPGFRPERVLTARVPLAGVSYSDPATQVRFFESLLDRMRSLPGVMEAGAVTNLPSAGGGTLTYRVEGQPEPDPAARPEVVQRGVAGDYFSAMGIPLIAGRTFTVRDDSSAQPVIVINEALAKQHFPAGNAVGQRFRFYAAPEQAWEIAGVVGDVKTGRLDDRPPATIYYSHLQVAENRMTLVLRAAGDPLSLAPAIRAEVSRLDPDVPVYGVSTMEEVVANSAAVFARRYPLVLIGAFAAAALVLALGGVYGMISWSVTQRRRELGIRSALGAPPATLLTGVLAESARVTLLGLASGCVLAFLFARTLSSTLYGIGPTDLVTYLAVAGLLALATLLASAWPARRAAAADPVQALRSE